ncbi:MAG: ABC transporter ATP-binding protein [Negativicutes bacterium]
MLVVESLEVRYGVIPALRGISLHVEQGEIVTLIGANGAGKSTTLKTISGLIRPAAGRITFEGKDLTTYPAHEIVGLGIAHVPEGRGIFPNLTVKENLKLATFRRKDGRKALEEDMATVFDGFPVLKERTGQMAGTLSGGEQQMLAIGRALMARPQLVLMDEPSMGLAPLLVRQIFDIIREINGKGTTVLLVEQNARMALSIAHRGYILETGEIIKEGTASELVNDPQVAASYLGY